MIEPARLSDFFAIFFSSALVILLGALYALLFALSRLKNQRSLLYLAYLSYAGLAASVLALAVFAHLLQHQLWITVVVLMLVGYLLAPHGIWYLCTSTHGHDIQPSSD